MKKLLFFALAFVFVGCTSSKWEYNLVKIDSSTSSDFLESEFKVTSEDLNLFGEEGWELVDVYTLTQTQHPHFGDDKYVTGIRENGKWVVFVKTKITRRVL